MFSSLASRVKAAHPDGELLAFSSPVLMSMERCIEVTLVRWSQASGSQVVDAALGEHLSDFWNGEWTVDTETDDPLNTTTFLTPLPVQELMDDEAKAWPLAAPLDLDRLGYLQLDLYPWRIYLPTLPGVDTAEVQPRDAGLEIKAQDQAIAEFSYWNAGWGPARPVRLGGNCGSALVSRVVSPSQDRSFYLWQVRTLHRTSTLGWSCCSCVLGRFLAPASMRVCGVVTCCRQHGCWILCPPPARDSTAACSPEGCWSPLAVLIGRTTNKTPPT